jgi:hypothetical protein
MGLLKGQAPNSELLVGVGSEMFWHHEKNLQHHF